ncbi:hypothetical protein IHE45_13G005800 [Dioscorea alata]|uniref:Uncharacterized protein n=1 Tax=Dioscorea alata TaxID=55571 RepID=A0ACB7UVX3_DIOAL|nr:hypothetical protein IHE45_13G005800 [Dioscorea alata]
MTDQTTSSTPTNQNQTPQSTNKTTTKAQSNKEKTTIKCFKAPYRILRSARDFYVRCFTGCAGRSQYGSMMGNPVRAVSAVPRGFSFHSQSTHSQEDISELIRVASRGSLGRSPVQNQGSSSNIDGVVPRSQSVAIGRIDEDKPCEFGDDVGALGLHGMYPRSRSCAVVTNKRRVGIVA